MKKENDEIINLLKQKIQDLEPGEEFQIKDLVTPYDWKRCDQKVVGTKFRSMVLNEKVDVVHSKPLPQTSRPASYKKK